MENQNQHKLTQFWLGFAFGGIAVGGAAYLLGTEKGRKILRQILDLSENLEENLLLLAEELEEKIEEETGKIKETVENVEAEHPKLNKVLHTIKSLTGSVDKTEKKFFIKKDN